MARKGGSASRRLIVTAAIFAVIASLMPVAVAAAAGASTSAEGDLFVVAVNAKQRDLDSARMDGLVDRLVNHTAHAPDVLFVSEITKTNLLTLRDRLNVAMDDHLAHYWTAGITTNSELTGQFSGSNIKVKILINSKTMDPGANVVWHDVCTDTRTYQLITAQERLADGSLGRPVALAGVHFAPSFNEGGSVECKQLNAEEARRQMAEHADSGIMGDFNRRATTEYYECNPDELGTIEPWYETMTGPSAADGRTYRDTVRAAHYGTPAMRDQWSWEKETTETLCTGTSGYKRSRLDYIFVSDEMTPNSAGTDQGWGTGAPGDPACSPTPGCKYSDHRFVWANVTISTHASTPTRPTDLLVTTPTAEGQLDLTWTASTGATAYDVYRYNDDPAVRTWQMIGTTTTTAYTDSDTDTATDVPLKDATAYSYRVVARDTVGHSRPSILASGTTASPAPNAAPVVTIAQPTKTHFEPGTGGTVTIDVAATATDDGTEPLTWQWTGPAGVTFADSTAATTTATLPEGTHTLTATATDSLGASGSDAIEILVAVNVAPVVTIDQPAPEATAVTADSSGSATVAIAASATDESVNSLTWAWTTTSADGVTFTNAAVRETTATLAVGEHTLTATATDEFGASHAADVTITVQAAPTHVDDVATSETAVAGTVSGTYLDTNTNNETMETVTETGSGGKPSARHNRLEHRWAVNVTGGETVEIVADVVEAASEEGFEFGYSIDGGSNWAQLFTVTASGSHSAVIGPYAGGQMLIRVVDTLRSSGDSTADAISVDHLYVRSDSSAALPAPGPVTATAGTDDSVTVGWTNVEGESGYEIARTTDDPASTPSPTWTALPLAAANTTSVIDGGLQFNTTYWYRVRAVASGGTSSSWSLSPAATTPSDPNPPTATTVVVSSLQGTSTSKPKGMWSATVTATVVDNTGAAVAGATVVYSWSVGASVTGTCTTDTSGTCTVTSSEIAKQQSSVTFTVSDVTGTALTYNASASDTSVTISKP